MLICFLLPSFAFRADSFQGQEPHRIVTNRFHEQYLLSQSDLWSDFQNGYPSWEARFDHNSGLPLRAWGKGISMGSVSSFQSSGEILGFLSSYSEMFHPKALGTLQIRQGRAGIYGHLEQLIPLNDIVFDRQGREISQAVVWRAGVDLFFKEAEGDAKLTMFGVELYPELFDQELSVAVSAQEAVDVAIRDGWAPLSEHSEIKEKLVVVPIMELGGLQLRPAWEIKSKTNSPVGHWVAFVDAKTGELFHIFNEVRFLEGALFAEHDTRTVDGERSVSALRNLRIPAEEGTIHTDELGARYCAKMPRHAIVGKLFLNILQLQTFSAILKCLPTFSMLFCV